MVNICISDICFIISIARYIFTNASCVYLYFISIVPSWTQDIVCIVVHGKQNVIQLKILKSATITHHVDLNKNYIYLYIVFRIYRFLIAKLQTTCTVQMTFIFIDFSRLQFCICIRNAICVSYFKCISFSDRLQLAS